MSRRTILGFGTLALALVLIAGLLLLRSTTYIPFLGDDTSVVYDVASLPDRLHVCGRSWSKDALDRQQSEADLVAASGLAPIAVVPRQFSACPAGACEAVDRGSCATVIFARVGQDSFVGYSLAGGP